MNRMRVAAGALLAITALLAGGVVRAEPREANLSPPQRQPETPEMKEARRLQMAKDMDTWLRRLPGRFRIQGVSSKDGSDEPDLQSATGMEDCIGLGTGAGVQCVINVVWNEQFGDDGQYADGGISSMAPAMLEYGLDPVASRIRYLQVDNQSLAEGAAGVLKGDTMTTRVRCANTPASQLCERVTRIYAPPDSKYVQVTIDMERNHDRVTSLSLDLRRMAADEAGAGAGVKLPQLPKEKDKEKERDQPRARQPVRRAPPAAPPARGGSRR
jgi:hypothetical protein